MTLFYEFYNLSSYSNLPRVESDGGNARIVREAAHASQCDAVGKRRLNACDSSLHTIYDAYAHNETPRKWQIVTHTSFGDPRNVNVLGAPMRLHHACATVAAASDSVYRNTNIANAPKSVVYVNCTATARAATARDIPRARISK